MRTPPWFRPPGCRKGFPPHALWWLLVATAFQGCATEKVTEVVVVSVTVRPGDAAVVEGGEIAFEAVVVDEEGAAQVGAPVVWSSDTPDVVVVDGVGLAHALRTGAATVEATYRGATGSASVLVTPGPSLVTDPAVVSFTGELRGDRPAPETVRITNGAPGRLTHLASVVTYASGERKGWLHASLSADATPATLRLIPNVGGLPAGLYHAVVVVTSGESGALSTPVSVRLSLVGSTVNGSASEPGS